MSVNIWGSGGNNETTENKISMSSLVITFIKKSGDIVRGVINMSNNRIVNIADPRDSGDAVNKKYIDAVAVHKNGDECQETLRIGSINDNNVEIIKNNEAYISLGNNFINVNRKLLLNLREPIGDSEAVTKRYFDNNAIHKGGESGLHESLKIGTRDEKFVNLIRNNETYILLDNDIEFYRAVNVNNKQIKNLRDPVNVREATHKGYVDSLHLKIWELINKNELGIVFLRKDGDSYINLNDNRINIEKDINFTLGSRIVNLPEPTGAFDAVTKQYSDLKYVHIGGNSDIIGGLKIGTSDNLPLHFIYNQEIYMTIFNNIDCVNHRVVNIADPVDETDAVNKKYVDLNKATKNYVGLIPENPQHSGFMLTYEKDGARDETINNITLNNADVWRSIASVDTTIDINLPYDVKIWGIYLNGTIDRFYTNNNRTRNIELLCRDTVLIRVGSRFSCNIIDSRQMFINIDNAPKHKYYRIVFKTNIPIVTTLCKLQLYIYND
jgi:hypothetical protein